MTARRLAGATVVALALLLAWTVLRHPETTQWDFRVYHAACSAWAEGRDPYAFEPAPGNYPFLYPPHALVLLRPLAALPYDTAARVFFMLKCGAAIGLVLLGARAFVRDARDGVFFLFGLLAFKGALWLDLEAGNVTVFEQLALWGAFACLVARRSGAFCALVVVASLFKLAPIVFLPLAAVTRDPRWKRHVALAAGAFVALLVADWALDPTLFRAFVERVTTWHESGMAANPSTYSLAQDVVAAAAGFFRAAPPPGVALGLYVVIAAVVVALTLARILRETFDSPERRIALVCTAAAAVALVLPRFKSYGFVMLVPAAYLAIRAASAGRRLAFAALLVLFVLSDAAPHDATPATTATRGPIHALLWRYWPLLLAFVTWRLWMREARQRR